MKITSDYVIQISCSADKAVGTAAEKLQQYLGKILGFTLRIRTDKNRYAKFITVGNTAFGFIAPATIEALNEDGCAYAVRGNDIHITGKTSRGVIYGVYSFLENVFGCRYFVRDDFYIPQGNPEIGDCSYAYSPQFLQRDMFDGSCIDPEYGMANHLNGEYYGLQEEHGGHFTIKRFCHTLPMYISPEEYYDEHPEYFALVNGVRLKKPQAQLCFSNPDLVDIVVEKILADKRADPSCRIFSVTQGDGYFFCECDACRAMYKKHNAVSAPMISFVNKVARAVRKEYPDIIIDILAYLHTRRPPEGMELEPNVMIRHCSIECCQLHTIGSCDFTEPRCFEPGKSYPAAEIDAEAKRWTELTQNVYAWDYPINVRYSFIPYPNFPTIQANLKRHRDLGFKGVFLNGIFAKYGSYSQLRSYLYAKCLWDPDCDMQRHYNEFMNFYYGAAADKMREAIRFLHERTKVYPLHSHCGYPFGMYPEKEEYFQGDFSEKYEKILNDALTKVKNDEKRRVRVQREMLTLPLVKLIYSPSGSEDFEHALSEFLASCRELGVGNLSESGSDEEFCYEVRTKDFISEHYAEYLAEKEARH